MKVNKDKYRKVIDQMQNSQIRRKNIADYFLNFSRLHRPWLHELAEAYKAKKDLPMTPIITLAQYYHDHRDQEVAAFAGLLLKSDCSYEKIQAVNEMFQYEPWDWFMNRRFVQMSLGDVQNKSTAGIQNWRWAKFFQNLYEVCFPLAPDFSPKIRRYVRALGQTFDSIRRDNISDSYNTLSYMLGDIKFTMDQVYYYRILLMLFGTEGGFGLGHRWNIPDEDLKCPLTDGIRDFLKIWYPNYTAYGTFDEAVSLFGFTHDSDFLYAYLGYQELLRKDKDNCRRYERTYYRWYEKGSKKRPYEWRNIQPEINL